VTKYPDLFAALAAHFDQSEVKTRQAPGGRTLAYITARTAMNRLDNVLGPENWWDEYLPLEHSVLCRLTIVLPDGKEVTKCDAGGYAGMADQGDDDKSGFSDAFKRACAKFGVGRYLYRDGVPEFVSERAGTAKIPSGQSYTEAPRQQPAPAKRQSQGGQKDQAPRSGKALFAWTKDMEQRHQVGLLNYLNNWGKLQEYPGRMIDWDADQVARAYAEAVRKLQAIQPARDEADAEALNG
jgi:hypothetical protein